jgi:hypothetical protein
MLKIDAANLLGRKESDLKEFCDNDPFNPGNQIRGYICMHANHCYGALVIFEVNGQPTHPQVVYGTPKLHYPFQNKDEGREFHWPKFKAVTVYEKLDGTNILAYSYADVNGKRYVTFKTRLTPILRSGNFGDFCGMWQEILEVYPQIQNVSNVLDGTFALSFELYGGRNPHLIKYNILLDFRLLFGIRQSDWAIMLPGLWVEHDIHVNKPKEIFKNSENIIEFYEKHRDTAQLYNKINEDGSIDGVEGFVFYATLEDGNNAMFKCKPEMVEAIHWKSDMIPMGSIVTTVINSIEDYEVAQGEDLYQSETFFNHIIELLKEEFTDAQIEKSHDRIKHGFHKGLDKLFLQQMVEEALKKVNLSGTKNEVMREMSQFFDRSQMTRVYNAMRDMGIFPIIN